MSAAVIVVVIVVPSKIIWSVVKGGVGLSPQNEKNESSISDADVIRSREWKLMKACSSRVKLKSGSNLSQRNPSPPTANKNFTLKMTSP